MTIRAVQRDLLASAIEKTDLVHELQFDAKNHSLMIRGEAYPHQLESMALGLYGEHDAWFQAKLGFTIGEALLVVDRVFRLAAWRRGEVLSTLEADRDDENRRREVLTQYAEAIIGFTVEELAAVSERQTRLSIHDVATSHSGALLAERFPGGIPGQDSDTSQQFETVSSGSVCWVRS